jgi:membrane-associated phospholipid phosphatase
MTATIEKPVAPPANRLARVITEVSAPAVCGVVGLLVAAIRNTGSGAGAAWGGLAAIFVCGLPMAYIAKGVKDGRWSDHHVAEREKRALPLLAALLCVGVGATLLVALDAPGDLIAMVLTAVPELIIAIAISHWWKISIHAAVIAGLLGIFLVMFGPWALLALPLVGVVGWSRTVLGAHTWAQVTAGAAIGWVVAVGVFATLR